MSQEKSQMENDFQKEMSENLGIPLKVVLFFEYPENTVSFITGNYRKFKAKFFIEWKVRYFSVWFSK